MNTDARNDPDSLLVYGEVLFDLFDDGQEVLGGAPFNVAWHLQGLGLRPLMISRVGRDRRGETVLATMERWGMATGGIQIDAQRPTGVVRAVVENGQPTFHIEPEQAYDFIEYEPSVLLEAGAAHGRQTLCHGTLALRHEVSQGTLSRLLAQRDPVVLIDVNLRAPWWTPRGVAACLDRARWVKLNDAEVDAIGAVDGRDGSPDVDAAPDLDSLTAATRSLLETHDLAGAIVTRGADGALWVDRADTTASADAEPVTDLIDTVGAGDAFTAVALVGLLANWPPTVLLRRAVAFAAAICRQQGATADAPELYEETLAKWEHDGYVA